MPVPWLCHLLAGQTWARCLAKDSIFSCKNEDDKPDLTVRIKGENAWCEVLRLAHGEFSVCLFIHHCRRHSRYHHHQHIVLSQASTAC